MPKPYPKRSWHRETIFRSVTFQAAKLQKRNGVANKKKKKMQKKLNK
jgi:hypothetical protein